MTQEKSLASSKKSNYYKGFSPNPAVDDADDARSRPLSEADDFPLGDDDLAEDPVDDEDPADDEEEF
jgi:hypothetical protein